MIRYSNARALFKACRSQKGKLYEWTADQLDVIDYVAEIIVEKYKKVECLIIITAIIVQNLDAIHHR